MLGERAIRIDMIERLSLLAHRLARAGPVAPTTELQSLIGCKDKAFEAAMRAIGFTPIDTDHGIAFAPSRKRTKKPKIRGRRQVQQLENSPFSALDDHPARNSAEV